MDIVTQACDIQSGVWYSNYNRRPMIYNPCETGFVIEHGWFVGEKPPKPADLFFESEEDARAHMFNHFNGRLYAQSEKIEV